jgi:hypothetical protein
MERLDGDAAVPPPPHLVGGFKASLGEGRLRRDLALYFAEEIADAFGRLLAWKAGKSGLENERHRLAALATEQAALLDRIRRVVLPSTESF